MNGNNRVPHSQKGFAHARPRWGCAARGTPRAIEKDRLASRCTARPKPLSERGQGRTGFPDTAVPQLASLGRETSLPPEHSVRMCVKWLLAEGGARRLLRKLVKQWSLQLAGALCTAKQVSRKFTRFTVYFNCIFCQLGLNSCDM